MCAKVSFTVEHKANTLVVPANAIVDVSGKKGVFIPGEGNIAKFQPVTLGMSGVKNVEIASGLSEGAHVISTGATALREGDRIVLLGQGQRGNGNGAARGDGRGRRGSSEPGAGGGGGERRGSPPPTSGV